MQDKRLEPIVEYDTPAYAPRKKRWGDRKEGRLLHTIPPMNKLQSFIMCERNDSQNQFEDVIDITNVEEYLDKKHAEGYTDMSLLHVLLAAYVRVVSERPAINRFIAGRPTGAIRNRRSIRKIGCSLASAGARIVVGCRRR